MNSQGLRPTPLLLLPPPCSPPSAREVTPAGSVEGANPVFPTEPPSGLWASPAPPPPHRRAPLCPSAQKEESNLRHKASEYISFKIPLCCVVCVVLHLNIYSTFRTFLRVLNWLNINVLTCNWMKRRNCSTLSSHAASRNASLLDMVPVSRGEAFQRICDGETTFILSSQLSVYFNGPKQTWQPRSLKCYKRVLEPLCASLAAILCLKIRTGFKYIRRICLFTFYRWFPDTRP